MFWSIVAVKGWESGCRLVFTIDLAIRPAGSRISWIVAPVVSGLISTEQT